MMDWSERGNISAFSYTSPVTWNFLLDHLPQATSEDILFQQIVAFPALETIS